MSQTKAILEACPLAHGWVAGECGWCGKELPRKKDGSISLVRRWCSSECSDTFSRNHSWAWARPAAVKRDGGACVKCGANQNAPDYAPLEVNHIHAQADAGVSGYPFGCYHHLDNLETLCRPCHVAVTTDQRRRRKHAEQRARVVEFGGEALAVEWEEARRKLGLVPGDPDPPQQRLL